VKTICFAPAPVLSICRSRLCSHHSKHGEVGAVDLGQRESHFLLVIASAPSSRYYWRGFGKGNAWNRGLAAGLFILLTLAGALDVFALVTSRVSIRSSIATELRFAETIKQQTEARATILHGQFITHRFSAGRRS